MAGCVEYDGDVKKTTNYLKMIFSGQVKKRKVDDIAAEPEKRLKTEPTDEDETSAAAASSTAASESAALHAAASAAAEKQQMPSLPPKRDGMECEFCGIVFSKATAHAAHVEFYCQKKVKQE